jgi:hypothetical protein
VAQRFTAAMGGLFFGAALAAKVALFPRQTVFPQPARIAEARVQKWPGMHVVDYRAPKRRVNVVSGRAS